MPPEEDDTSAQDAPVQTETQEVPVYLHEQLSELVDDLVVARREEGSAAEQHKECKARVKKLDGELFVAASALVHPAEDGYPEDTPMADLAGDTPDDAPVDEPDDAGDDF